MSFLKLAVPLLLLAAMLPTATATPPPGGFPGAMTISVGDVAGIIKEDSMSVVPFKGNATVPFNIVLDCSLLVYEAAQAAPSQDPGLHVEVAGTAPTWLITQEHPLDASLAKVGSTCAAGSGRATFAGDYKFGVTAGAPGILPQTFNITANLREDYLAPAAQVIVSVQFHPDYSVTPSIQFPYTVTGQSVNFTVTTTNNGNSRSMIMFEGLDSSTGSFGGLVSQAYQPPASVVFPVTFKAPTTCWTDATVKFHTASHFLTLGQQAGSYRDERDFVYQFHNGIACTPGKGNTSGKASPMGGLVVIPALLGVALLMRRKLL